MKCSVCGKGGLFRKVNESGICCDCELAALRSECANLNKTIDEIGARDAITVQNKIAEYKSALEGIQDDVHDAKDKLQKLEIEIKEKRDEIIVLDDNIMLESFALYKPKFNFLTSEEYKEKITITREKEKILIRDDKAASGNANWTVNGSVVEGRKMIRDLKKLFLRAFNNECDYCIDNVKFNNIEASEKRLEKSFETINKLGRVNSVEITPEYKRLKYQELYLAYEYQKKKEEEKEEQKRARAELREQQKLEKEIREARERIAKERKHFSAAMKDLENKLGVAVSETDRAAITTELEKIQAQYAELEKEEKIVDYREQNANAGYVYIISNIGAFGKDVYKIGMTRRLEPMDRIDELGDASVPFVFDVHAMIFSENAPDLEAKLHKYFYNNRVNKINDRKEFYRADINEIEKVIKENYKNIVDVVKDAPAEQYRESLLVESAQQNTVR